MYRNNVVWELRASKTDELIATFNDNHLEDFEFSKQPEEIQKKIKKIVLSISDFNGFDENDFDEWYYYIATISESGEEDYYSLNQFKREADFNSYPLYFLKTFQREDFNETADYYTVQDIAGYEDSMVILASYKTFEEAERYCKKHNISVNNILPQNFGEDFLDITEM